MLRFIFIVLCLVFWARAFVYVGFGTALEHSSWIESNEHTRYFLIRFNRKLIWLAPEFNSYYGLCAILVTIATSLIF